MFLWGRLVRVKVMKIVHKFMCMDLNSKKLRVFFRIKTLPMD